MSGEVGMADRNEIYKNSDLPYSFLCKMTKAFIGKRCPICNCRMGVVMRDKDDPIITRTPMPTIQHNIPLSKGGKHEIDNISIICKRCNISIQDNVTGDLNNREVKELWQTMIKNVSIG